MTKQSIKIGSVSWDDPQLDFTKSQPKKAEDPNKLEFVKITEEGNQLRLITDAHQYIVHNGVQFEGDDLDPKKMQKFGYSVKCSQFGPDGKCPICEANQGKPKEEQSRWIKKWYFGVIERTLDGAGDVDHSKDKVKILDVKKSVVGKFSEYTKTKNWKNPLQYDFIIKKHPNAEPINFYSVTTELPQPLTAEEIQMKENFDLSRLQDMVAAPTYQEVVDILARIRKWLVLPNAEGAKSNEAPKASDDAAFTFAQA